MARRGSDDSQANDVFEKIRWTCIARGGSGGINNVARVFRIYDDNSDRQLNHEEFAKGMHDYGLRLSDDEIKEAFEGCDVDGSGTLSFNEFLKRIRPPLNERRISIIKEAYAKLDRDEDGVITKNDLKGVFNVSKHPKYLSGELTEDDLFKKFLANFQIKGSKEEDGKITFDEFLNYYSGVSSSIDNDAYFDLMMRQAWKL